MALKFLPLIWFGITRHPGRTLLTFLQIVVAFALFGVLQGMKTGAQTAMANSRADLLDVRPAVSGSGPLPSAYLARIRSLPNVKLAVLLNGFSATYQNPSQHIYALALDPGKQWQVLAPDIFKITPQALNALATHRDGVLVTRALMKKYGWTLGSQVPLIATDTLQATGSADWAFDVVGTYSLHQVGSPGDMVVINNEYLDGARASDKGTAVHFVVLASSPYRADAVAHEIDWTFANSAHPTRTQSYRDNAEQQMRAIGDLGFVIRAVVGAVLAAMLLSSGTMMMHSFRDRMRELAMLKAMGYSGFRVLTLILAEATTIFLAAAALGLGTATMAFPFAEQEVPGLSIPPAVVAAGIAGAVVLALLSASVPAAFAARLEIKTCS